MYKAYKIQIKKGHRLYDYFLNHSKLVNNLFNTTTYYYRQIISGYEKGFNNDNQQVVLKEINEYLALKEKPLFLEDERSFVNYNLLDGVFKTFNNKDYRALPTQTSQQIMMEVHNNFKSFYSAIKEYFSIKDSFTGRPKLPNYSETGSLKTVHFTNQSCKIKESKFLSFPKTKLKLNIGKLSLLKNEATLKGVRIVPHHNVFDVEIVLFYPEDKTIEERLNQPSKNICGIDLGIDNFATIVNNVGLQPVIVKGKALKSMNRYFNKNKAFYTSILTKGKSTTGVEINSNRLSRLGLKRKNKIDDFMHKASSFVLNYCLSNNIDTVVIGNNKQWKTGINIGKRNNQKFVSIPYTSFVNKLKYKLAYNGIKLIETEESYTSKASFIDDDKLPTYKENETYIFSGNRTHRGMYVSKEGLLLNADCNGAGNIIKKVFPEAFSRGNRGVVNTPVIVNVLS